MYKKLNAVALGYASALLSAICMVVLGILGNLGIYEGAVAMMGEWHLFFSLSVGGIIAGAVEAAIGGFILAYIFAVFYNRFVGKE